MEKIIIYILLILFIPLTAQQAKYSLQQQASNTRGGRLFTDTDVFRVNNKNLSYDEIKGNPYHYKNFSLTKFINSENTEIGLARYNSYTDEIEIKKNDEIYSLPSNNPFTKIELTETKEILIKLDTEDDLKGYFFELVNGKNSLYKKIKTKLNDYVSTVKPNVEDRPINFEPLDPIYYIKTDKGSIKKIKNQKTIIGQFPDKEDLLKTFFKTNKIKFDKEEDLIKLVKFLNQ